MNVSVAAHTRNLQSLAVVTKSGVATMLVTLKIDSS